MKRRDFVKGIAVASAAATTALGQKATQKTAPAPAANPSTQSQGTNAVAPETSSGRAAQSVQAQQMQFHTPNIPLSVPDVVSVTDTRFFSPLQYATLERFCAVLMPALNGYPSAGAAGTPEFLDFLVGSSPADRKKMYTMGLDRLNADAQKQFHVPFSKVDDKQADALIRPHLETWINDHPPTEPYKNFIAVAHRDIRTATMNSEAWNASAVASGERAPGVGLYWKPIDPDIKVYV